MQALYIVHMNHTPSLLTERQNYKSIVHIHSLKSAVLIIIYLSNLHCDFCMLTYDRFFETLFMLIRVIIILLEGCLWSKSCENVFVSRTVYTHEYQSLLGWKSFVVYSILLRPLYPFENHSFCFFVQENSYSM